MASAMVRSSLRTGLLGGQSATPASRRSFGSSGGHDDAWLDINGLPSKEASSKVIEWVEETGNGNRKGKFQVEGLAFFPTMVLGEPIPVVFLDDTNETVPIQETDLPLTLPELDDFTPTRTGDPPLSKEHSWVRTNDPLSGKPARCEKNSMPQWVGSCWYYLRFMDPNNSDAMVDKKKEINFNPSNFHTPKSCSAASRVRTLSRVLIQACP